MRKKEFNDDQINEIIDLYLNHNFSLKKIGEKFEVSRTVISRLLKEKKIEKRERTTKYIADYTTFEKIDNPEKAYWLGFIAADGCIYIREQNASILIALSRKDKQHLEKFKTFMKSNVNIIDYTNNTGFSAKNPSEMSKIVFNSKKMANDFYNLNIKPKKSITMGIPNIKEEYYLPFILGYFDGDGSIFKTSQGEFGINIIGSYDFITWVNEILKISSKLEQRKQETPIYHIRCGGSNKPYLILKQLYDSCETHLERKYKLFKELETVVLNRNIK